jgi:hypothetical protein
MSDRRDDARELLRELVSELLSNGNGNVNVNGTSPVPQVPPPPVAAVHRPSSWKESTADASEQVTITGDEELNAFVRALATRLEDHGTREAIRTGRLRFTLNRAPATHARAGGATRIEKGAVTERTIREAAANGQRLVLARGAVLTPLARDQARKLRVEIEKEQT